MGGGTATQAHLNAPTCNALQRDQEKDIIEHGRRGRNREEANPHLPEGPNQTTLTYLAQQHETSNMGNHECDKGGARPGRYQTGSQQRCGDPYAAKMCTPGQDPIPHAHGCVAVGIQTMVLSDSDR